MQQNDFFQMQNQAIRYAMEMQRRATPQRVPEPQPKPPPPPPEQYPTPDQVFGHRNPWSQERETPFCRNACPVKNILGMGSGGGKQGDNDIMLLMALLLVLSSDGGDKMLMMALLYIMT